MLKLLLAGRALVEEQTRCLLYKFYMLLHKSGTPGVYTSRSREGKKRATSLGWSNGFERKEPQPLGERKISHPVFVPEMLITVMERVHCKNPPSETVRRLHKTLRISTRTSPKVFDCADGYPCDLAPLLRNGTVLLASPN